jgi:hypothetical protein
MSVIFCLEKQRRSIVSWMEQLGIPVSLRSPRTVSEYDTTRMQGLDDIVFFDIPNHPERTPELVWAALRQHGATIVRIDDNFARERYSRRGR